MEPVVSALMRFRARIADPLPYAVLALLVGFAAGRIDLLDGLNPVAIPLYLINLCLGLLAGGPLTAGILLGTVAAGAGGQLSWALWRLMTQGFGMLTARALVRSQTATGVKQRVALYGALSQAAGAWLIPLLVHTPDKPAPLAWMAAGIEVLLAALVALLLQGAGDASADRWGHTGRWLALGVLAVLGLQGLSLPLIPLRLDYLMAAVLVLAASFVDGVHGGTIAGTAAGLALLVGHHMPATGGPAFASMAATGVAFAAGGLAAGAFYPLGRSFASVGFLLAFGGTVFWAGLPDTGLQGALLLPAVLAAAVGGLAPLPSWLTEPALAPRAAPGDAAAPPTARDRVQRLSEVLQEAGRAFEQAAPARPPVPVQTLGGSFETVQQQVCQGCSLYRRCWETDFYRTVQTFEGIWRRVEEDGRISPRHVPDELTHYCIYPGAVLATLNSLQELEARHRQWERRVAEGRALVAGYVHGVASILGQVADELRPDAVPAAQPVLAVRHGLARLPGRGALVSGDSVLAEAVTARTYLLVLSDGMGVGMEAARESRQAVTLLRQLLGAGFSPSLAVQTVNAALLLGASEDSFATIDLVLIDLVRGRAEFIKTGAVASLVRRGDDITFVRGSAPPAGILHQVRVEPEVRPVGPGDVMVMVTDGLWQREGGDQERWLAECLRQAGDRDPQAIADSILARAIEVCDPGDDMTVLVASMESVSGGAAAATHRRSPAREPRPVMTARR